MQVPLAFKSLSKAEMLSASRKFVSRIVARRTVRDFSDQSVDYEIIENAVRAAASAPSGANKQPWHFVVVANDKVKKTKVTIYKFTLNS